jgi:hypothetical protein
LPQLSRQRAHGIQEKLTARREIRGSVGNPKSTHLRELYSVLPPFRRADSMNVKLVSQFVLLLFAANGAPVVAKIALGDFLACQIDGGLKLSDGEF